MTRSQRNLILSEIRKTFNDSDDTIAEMCGHKFIAGKIMEHLQYVIKDGSEDKSFYYTHILHWAIRGLYAAGRDEASRRTA